MATIARTSEMQGTQDVAQSATRTTRPDRGTALLIAGALLLALSLLLPYWRIRLNAPQYPSGLFVTVYVNHLEGDVGEVDGLNHYIGMRPLDEAARFERSIATPAVGFFALLLAAAALTKRRWSGLLALPAILFPLIFLADMWLWLWYFGNNLDPTAALSSSIDPFTPALLGTGVVGQFSTTAMLQPGWFCALGAALLAGTALYLRREVAT